MTRARRASPAPVLAAASAHSAVEQNDEWAVQRARYMSLESVATLSDNPIVSLPIMAA